jgi:hypothetical protein
LPWIVKLILVFGTLILSPEAKLVVNVGPNVMVSLGPMLPIQVFISVTVVTVQSAAIKRVGKSQTDRARAMIRSALALVLESRPGRMLFPGLAKIDTCSSSKIINR